MISKLTQFRPWDSRMDCDWETENPFPHYRSWSPALKMEGSSIRILELHTYPSCTHTPNSTGFLGSVPPDYKQSGPLPPGRTGSVQKAMSDLYPPIPQETHESFSGSCAALSLSCAHYPSQDVLGLFVLPSFCFLR